MRTGLDALVDRAFADVAGARVGLVTHAAAHSRLRSASALFAAACGARLLALFAPEHGPNGLAQDLEGVRDERDPLTGLSVVSLYGSSVASLRPPADLLRDLDVLVIDLVDVGSRYYTFQATMLYCLQAAAEIGLAVLVLDRPNPLGGVVVEGPTVAPGMDSFVGAWPLAIRHGLTMGEMARMYHSRLGLANQLRIVPCEGWLRDMRQGETGLPWVMPSPNMPTPDTALVYPGTCLLEGTNLSEGRGTTRPFELVGYPRLSAGDLAKRLNAENLPGVIFRPVRFRPGFQKHAGKTCDGVQLHPIDPEAFLPVRTGLAVLAALRRAAGQRFAWRTDTYEFVEDRPAIDLLFGSDRERLGLEAGRSWRDLAAAWVPEEEAFRVARAPFLLYD